MWQIRLAMSAASCSESAEHSGPGIYEQVKCVHPVIQTLLGQLPGLTMSALSPHPGLDKDAACYFA